MKKFAIPGGAAIISTVFASATIAQSDNASPLQRDAIAVAKIKNIPVEEAARRLALQKRILRLSESIKKITGYIGNNIESTQTTFKARIRVAPIGVARVLMSPLFKDEQLAGIVRIDSGGVEFSNLSDLRNHTLRRLLSLGVRGSVKIDTRAARLIIEVDDPSAVRRAFGGVEGSDLLIFVKSSGWPRPVVDMRGGLTIDMSPSGGRYTSGFCRSARPADTEI